MGEEEIEFQLKKVKKKKATGVDGIVEEAWFYSQIRERFKELPKRIWKGESFPEKWRKGVIISRHKKGDISDVRNYGRATLLCTAYKIYAAILAEKLREEKGEKKSA